MKLSVLMPVFNEALTLEAAISRVLNVAYPCEMELVVVDDGSTDSSDKVLAALSDPRLVVRRHERNRGKGAAIRTASDTAERGLHRDV